jgi:hypothetical protein
MGDPSAITSINLYTFHGKANTRETRFTGGSLGEYGQS